MVTKTEIVQAVERVRRQARVLPPDLDLLCQVAEAVVAKASYAILSPPKEERRGAGGGEAKASKQSFDRVAYQRQYMRDYRAGRRRRPTSPTASDT